MDEVVIKRTFRSKVYEKILGLVIIEPISFSSKKSINFRGLGIVAACLMSLFCLVVFLMPMPEEQTKTYNERKTETPGGGNGSSQNPDGEVKNPLDPKVIQSGIGSGSSSSAQSSNRNTVMVIPRESDSRLVKLKFRMVPNLTREDMPVPKPKEVLGLVCNTEVSNQGSSKTKGIIVSDTKPNKEAA